MSLFGYVNTHPDESGGDRMGRTLTVRASVIRDPVFEDSRVTAGGIRLAACTEQR